MMDIYQLVSSAGVIFAMGMSILSVVRSSKKQQSDDMRNLTEILNKHILDDRTDITELKTQFIAMDKKMDRTLDTLEKKK
jgi:transposase